MPSTKALAALMRIGPLNSVVLGAATHRRDGNAADGTGSQVDTWLIDRCRARINWERGI